MFTSEICLHGLIEVKSLKSHHAKLKKSKVDKDLAVFPASLWAYSFKGLFSGFIRLFAYLSLYLSLSLIAHVVHHLTIILMNPERFELADFKQDLDLSQGLKFFSPVPANSNLCIRKQLIFLEDSSQGGVKPKQ